MEAARAQHCQQPPLSPLGPPSPSGAGDALLPASSD